MVSPAFAADLNKKPNSTKKEYVNTLSVVDNGNDVEEGRLDWEPISVDCSNGYHSHQSSPTEAETDGTFPELEPGTVCILSIADEEYIIYY